MNAVSTITLTGIDPQVMWAAVAVFITVLAAIVALIVTGHEEFVMWALGGLTTIAVIVWLFP